MAKVFEFYHLFVKIMQKGTKLVKREITSFIKSDSSFCLPYFFEMLDNFYSLNILNLECLSTWDCSESAKWLA